MDGGGIFVDAIGLVAQGSEVGSPPNESCLCFLLCFIVAGVEGGSEIGWGCSCRRDRSLSRYWIFGLGSSV